MVMPSFNSARTVRGSMGSVLGQSFSDLELIIIDDGSSDDTLEIVREIQKQDGRVVLLTSEGNQGAAKARNRGIHAARGELLAFLDSDDTWTTDCLEKLHAALVAHPSATQSYCGWQNQGLEPNRCKPYIPPEYEGPGKLETFVKDCPFPIHAVLTKTAAIREEGGFDETLNSCMDFDLWMRVGWCREVVRVPEVMAFYLHHAAPHRISLNRLNVSLNHWKVQRKFLDSHPEAVNRLGKEKIRELTDGELLKRGMDAYWKRDLKAARPIFKVLIKTGYLDAGHLRYMLPALLPESWHAWLLDRWSGKGGSESSST